MFKKTLFFTVLFAFSSQVFCNDEAQQATDFTPELLAVTFKVTATQHSPETATFFDKVQELIAQAPHDEKPSFYQNIIELITNLHAAISSGSQLFSSTTFTNKPLVNSAKEDVEEFIAQETQVSRNDDNAQELVAFTAVVTVSDAQDATRWLQLKEQVLALVTVLQDRESSAQELEVALIAAAQALSSDVESSIHGTILLSAATNDVTQENESSEVVTPEEDAQEMHTQDVA